MARFVNDITLLATTYHCIQNLEHLRGNTNAICNQWPRQFVVAEYHKILEVTEWLFTARGRHSGQNTKQPCQEPHDEVYGRYPLP